jgi:hypothetical protein
VPKMTIVELSPTAQAHMVAEVRRARYGYVLALQLLLLCAAQRRPTEMAPVLCCSRSTVSRVVRADRAGDLEGRGAEGAASPPARRPGLGPALQRSMPALLKTVPRLWGWCRTRWSCATLALALQARRGGW